MWLCTKASILQGVRGPLIPLAKAFCGGTVALRYTSGTCSLLGKMRRSRSLAGEVLACALNSRRSSHVAWCWALASESSGRYQLPGGVHPQRRAKIASADAASTTNGAAHVPSERMYAATTTATTTAATTATLKSLAIRLTLPAGVG